MSFDIRLHSLKNEFGYDQRLQQLYMGGIFNVPEQTYV